MCSTQQSHSYYTSRFPLLFCLPVILGSEFDTRAYRYTAAHPTVKFYEVDTPAVITAKQAKALELGWNADMVTYIPGDITRYVFKHN